MSTTPTMILDEIPLKVKTNQEAFDFAYRYLRDQKERCIDDIRASCSYVNERGNRCVFGAMFDCTDDELRETFSYHHVDLFAGASAASEIVNIGEVNLDLIACLQSIHDGTQRGTPNWLKQPMRDLAYRFGLSARVLDEE